MKQVMNWHYPTEIFCGINARESLISMFAMNAVERPLIIIDKFLLSLPVIQDYIQLIKAAVNVTLYDEVKPNPTITDLLSAMKLCDSENCDAIVSLGGGSVLDVGKSVALLAKQSLHPWELEDVGDNYLNADRDKILPCIAIPTTAGTGSEVGRAALIIDEELKRKRFIFHPDMMPDAVILDPELSKTMPASLTAATGMDALAHNLEALCVNGYHPMADGIAMQGLKLIKDNLQQACTQGDDLVARQNMLVASMMGGTAFQKGLGAVHSLSHPVGAYYNAHHGLLNSIFMPYVLQFNRSVIEEKMTDLAAFLRLPKPSFTAVLDWLLALRDSLGLPHTLSGIPIAESDYEKLAEEALLDPSTPSNPRKLDKTDLTTILENAMSGIL